MNNYRVEYEMIGADVSGAGERIFPANSDVEAKSLLGEICQQEQEYVNKDIKNRFWHFKVNVKRLIRIDQPEIITEIQIN